MPTAKKSTQKKKASRTIRSATSKAQAKRKSAKGTLLAPATKAAAWRKSLRPRSPHRSFRRTYQRDYVRSLTLPGYVAFTIEVWRTLWRYKSTFLTLVIVYAVLSGLLVGMASQSTYSQIGDVLRSTSGDVFSGNFKTLGEAGTLLLVGASGGFNAELSESGQLVAGALALMIWLVSIWMLRALLAGQTPRLRDGFYNAGAPLVPTLLLAMLLLLQLVPAAIAAIGISAAIPTGFVSQGIEAMLFWVVAILLGVLSLYWITSTLLALVVVTLPGMYPLHALKSAHELVVGRRLRIVLRIAWLLFVMLFAWAITMIPIIIFDAWIKDMWAAIEWVPIVPVALLLASSASMVWTASYIYLLYRKVVDDDAAPA